VPNKATSTAGSKPETSPASRTWATQHLALTAEQQQAEAAIAQQEAADRLRAQYKSLKEQVADAKLLTRAPHSKPDAHRRPQPGEAPPCGATEHPAVDAHQALTPGTAAALKENRPRDAGG
jgi:exonuclease SbcC